VAVAISGSSTPAHLQRAEEEPLLHPSSAMWRRGRLSAIDLGSPWPRGCGEGGYYGGEGGGAEGGAVAVSKHEKGERGGVEKEQGLWL
jgi:hypothetical protein